MTTTSYICAKCKEPNAGTRCAACGCEQFTWVGASPSAEDCTVGDLRPGERAQALEDLHGPATGKTCIPCGTAFRVESRLYSSTALVFAEDGTALRVALTGKVRRLTAAPTAPLSHEEQRAQIASAAEEAQRDPASLLPAGWPGAPARCAPGCTLTEDHAEATPCETAPAAALPIDPEALRARLRALPREELERRLESVILWVAAPDEPTNGGDVVEFLGTLLHDVMGPAPAEAMAS